MQLNLSKDCRKLEALSNEFVESYFIGTANHIVFDRRTIVVNLGSCCAKLDGFGHNFLLSGQSTVLEDSTLASGTDIFVVEIKNQFFEKRVVETNGWERFSEEVSLWRSPQENLGAVSFCPSLLTCCSANKCISRKVELRTNFWFAEQGTPCGIHRDHDFAELHTQIIGLGSMQKFHSEDSKTHYEEVCLASGNTHRPFMKTKENGFEYPWHQYYAYTDCLWLALEFYSVEESKENI